MRISAIIAISFCWSAFCNAQQLSLRNTSDNAIVMKYLPRSRRPQKMAEIIIPANGRKNIALFEDDPYDVSFYLKPKKDQHGTTQVFHAKVGRPIRLRALATQGPIDVSLVLAAKSGQGGTIYQGTMAALQSNNSRVEVFGPAESAPALSKQILGRRWETVYRASDGNSYNAGVDFGNLRFSTQSFSGRFTDLAVFEDATMVHMVGKWSALNSRGDVFFSVKKSTPDVLEGEYTFAGQEQRYFWRSR